ncbi:MAG: leucine-rich repeat domain-containing protein [Saprospiraceae bacterium]|nr:leucine-rich repeat domain-containing protein [Saprospiraceae bacterium]
MEDKPKEILELERALGIDHVDYYRWDGEKVTEMRINNKGIKDISPLSTFVHLKALSLNANLIEDITPLQNLVFLEELYLVNNQIVDISPLSDLHNLRILYLHGNQISDISPLMNLTNIIELDLSKNNITDIIPLKEFIKAGSKLSFELLDFTVKIILLYYNPIPKHIIKIIERGNEAILEYFETIEKEKKKRHTTHQ